MPAAFDECATDVRIEEMSDRTFRVAVYVDGRLHDAVDFPDLASARAGAADLLKMLRAAGAVDRQEH